MLPILLISNYLKRVNMAEKNQRKGSIRNASSTDVEFLIAGKMVYLISLKLNLDQLTIIEILSTSFHTGVSIFVRVKTCNLIELN